MQAEPQDQVTEDRVETETDTATSEVEETTAEVTEDTPEVFPRHDVEELRQENGKYRQRATGRLADPTDIEFNEAHLDDADALAAAVGKLLTRKPHLASRRPTGEIGQGASPPAASSVDLAALLRRRAR